MSCSGERGEEGQPAAHLPGQSRARAAHSPLRVRRADTPAMPGMTRMRTAGLLPARGACSLASPGRREGQDALCTGSGSKWSECLQGEREEVEARGRQGVGGVPTLGGAQGRTSLARKPPYDFATPGEGRENPGSRLFFPPPGAGLKKKKKEIHHGSKTSVEFNSAAAALLGFRNPNGFAVVHRPRFFFFFF